MQSDPGFGAAPGRDDDLVEKVARAIADILLEDAFEGDAASEWRRVAHIARAALSVARAAIKEECARVAIKEARELEIANATDRDTWAVQVRSGGIITAKDIAAAIRAME